MGETTIMVLLSFFMAIVPAAALVVYYYRQDRYRPEPKGLILKIFFIGILSTLPAILIELALQRIGNLISGIPFLFPFIKAFIIAALVEESIKLYVVKRYAYNRVEFDEEMDGVVYAVIAGLGFACFENILYVSQGGVFNALMRAFTAVPMHAFASGLMGHYIGRAKFTDDKTEAKQLVRRGLLTAVGIHGAYDFALFSVPDMMQYVGQWSALVAFAIFPILIAAFIQLRKNIRNALERDHEAGRS